MKKLKKIGIVLGSIILVLGLFWGIVNLIPSKKVITNNPFMKTDQTLISAHRGGALLNPENTEMAFDYVILETNYTDIVEIDVRTTKDSKLVIIHDETVNRTALDEESEEVYVSDCSVLELKQYNLGYNFVDRNNNRLYEDYSLVEASLAGLTIMTLEEFLIKYYKCRDILLYLEIKEKDDIAKNAADIALKLLEEYSWWKERTMIISFDDPVIDYISSKDPNQLVGALGYKIAPVLILNVFALDTLFTPNYQCLQTKMSNTVGVTLNCATKRLVDECHEKNMAITYWTINEEEDMKKLIEIGVDIITTNAPDVLAKLLGKI